MGDVEPLAEHALDLAAQAVTVLTTADEHVGGERVEKPEVIRQTWRSWTLVTPSTARIAWATACASISDGVASIRIDVESRSTLHALATIRRAMPMETSGSTSVQPVVTITSAATRTPHDPSRSATT